MTIVVKLEPKFESAFYKQSDTIFISLNKWQNKYKKNINLKFIWNNNDLASSPFSLYFLNLFNLIEVILLKIYFYFKACRN